MNICVRKTCNLFERKGSHTFCVSKAFIRIEEDGSEEIKHIDLKASGVAVCNKIDEYNLEFGKALAQSRADKRLDRKIEKFLVKLSEKNVKKIFKHSFEDFVINLPAGVGYEHLDGTLVVTANGIYKFMKVGK